jgi:hypothetical protein
MVHFVLEYGGGAGPRYQATREITSFWYPVWLAYPAGLVTDSRLVDGPAQRVSPEGVVEIGKVKLPLFSGRQEVW